MNCPGGIWPVARIVCCVLLTKPSRVSWLIAALMIDTRYVVSRQRIDYDEVRECAKTVDTSKKTSGQDSGTSDEPTLDTRNNIPIFLEH